MNSLPDLFVERLAAGEVVDDPRASSPDVGARVEALQQLDRELLARFPPSRIVPGIVERTGRMRRGPVLTWSALGAVLVAAAALLIVVPSTASDPEVRSKGTAAASLQVMRKLGASAEPLGDGAQVRAGDVLQLSYRVPSRQHGMILSFDGAGEVTVHLPASGSVAQPLGPGEGRLDHAYQLDAAPAYERFVLLTSSEPFAVAEAVDAARAIAVGERAPNAQLALDPDINQQTVTLLKVPR